METIKDSIKLINPQSETHKNENESISQVSILQRLACQIDEVDFRAKVEKHTFNVKINQKHYVVIAIETILNEAIKNKWGLCKRHDFIYIYNGCYWETIDKEEFQNFLAKAALNMGVPNFDARHFAFKESLFKQFLSDAYLETPDTSRNKVLINLQNGTFEITPQENKLRDFSKDDFLTYQLPFSYDENAKKPLFDKFINRVLPDESSQKVLAEYLGFLFLKNGSETIKEEKALILFGGGANGKSVVFHIVSALLGEENISHHSLQSLTNENGYYRANLANKLVNYASEINGQMDTSVFKQLVSGEPVEARLPYGRPFVLKQYAKLIFNCNELPRDVEQTNGYFRRFLIIPFNVTIPQEEQDKELHTKITNNELAGIFNWVLEGLERLVAQKGFSSCSASETAVNRYKLESDSVCMFLEDNNYKPSASEYITLKDIYNQYRQFALEEGYTPVSKRVFKSRLINVNYAVERKSQGFVTYIQRDCM